MPLSNRTLGRLLVGVPLAAILSLVLVGALFALRRTPVPPEYFGCWRTDSALVAIERPRSLTYYHRLIGGSDHLGGWIQTVTPASLTVRVFVFPLRFATPRPPWQDSLGWHIVLDSTTYTRDSAAIGDGECQS